MAGNDKKPADKAVNAGPMRGDNTFPVSNKAQANHSSRGGGGAAGDGGAHAAAANAKAPKAAKAAKPGKTGGKGKPA